jgi:hypothetical protein
MKNSFDQKLIHVAGSELRYTDAGSGNAVVLLQSGSNRILADELSKAFHVIRFEVGAFGKDSAVPKLFGQAVAELGISKFCLIAESELASAAISYAIGSGDSLEALVFIAPLPATSNGASAELPLEQILVPTLVLFGTRDQVVAPETGRIYAQRIAKCFYTLVYDAGHEIGADRPQALCTVVRDFLEHREKFLVPRESSIINP